MTRLRRMRPVELWFVRGALAFALSAPPLLWAIDEALTAGIYTLELELASSVTGAWQIFYDRGEGVREADSTTVIVRASTEPVRERFQLPAGTFRVLRIDPPATESTARLGAARILDASGQAVTDIPLDAIVPAAQVQAGARAAGAPLQLVIPPGSNDPQLVWSPAAPLVLATDPRSTAALVGVCAAIYLSTLLLVVALGRLLWPVGERGEQLLRRAGAAGAARPHLAIACAALLGTTVAMYPVIFLGRSLVSPLNGGTNLLYDRIPFGPGVHDRIIENIRGTDNGAGMWAFVPYSHVQRLAIADGEWPLWNRYNATGRPLWGQGQSQILDPLHWLTLLPRDPAIGWDAKFVAHRLVFALGAGVAVFWLTTNWPAALLTAFAAPFVSYYFFRFNHPAQFAFSYGPWLICAWATLAGAATRRALARAAAALAVTTSLVLVASPPKEAIVTLLCLHLTGLLMITMAPRSWGLLARQLAAAAVGGAIAILLTAPHWIVFLTTLAKTMTYYDTPHARFATWPFAVALMFGVLAPGQILPGAHPLAISGALGALVSRRGWQTAATAAIAVGPVVALSVGFGIIPEHIIVALPFFSNIHQIDYTFLGAGIVLAAIASGVGASMALQADPVTLRVAPIVWVMVAFAIGWRIVGLGLLVDSAAGWAMIFATAGAALIPLLLDRAARHWPDPLPIAALTAMTLWLLVPNGLHAPFAWRAPDELLLQPRPRVPLEENSPAIDAIARDRRAPSRVVGIEQTLFPGSYALYEVEGIAGPDALQLPWYEELLNAHPLERYWEWNAMVRPGDTERAGPLLDLLGVGYFLLRPSDSVPGIAPVPGGTPDLLVPVRRSSPWPRAFFASGVARYQHPGEFLKMAAAGSFPIAAIQTGDEQARQLTAGLLSGGGPAVAADSYTTTANSTEFTVRSTGPGVAVLTEAWMPDDFVATVNGEEVGYFRVNHAFKAVSIPGRGEWRVRFEYRPAGWGAAWRLALAGAVALVGIWAFGRRPSSI